ncbi:sigma factor-like helix-turn-helix DNA-binding protein [Streptomyces sp. NPDC058391]|uniref:sigma factor-like helix-turn-helix DNA-binding protein n=1 Tax=Streptomyces sp. NPDC058391 TaxID=3346476 RepID=UPI00365313DF
MTQSTTPRASATPLPSPEERRRLREAKPMTEKQVARAVGVARSTIRSWETGRTPPRGRKGEVYAKLLAGFEAERQDKAAQAAKAAAEAAEAAEVRSAARQEGREQDREQGRPAAQDRTKDTKEQESAARRPRRSRHSPRRVPTASPITAAAAIALVEREKAVHPGMWGGAGPRMADDMAAALTPAQAFDALYAFAAPALVRQAYLLTGRRNLSQNSVERAFHLAWERWPEVAVDRDPAGWVRAAAYEYAMSPWHRTRRTGKKLDVVPGEHEGRDGRELREALLALPPSYRRTLLLYDGLGLDLPETAAETEASTPATARRLIHARKAVAGRLPELTDAELLHERLGALTLSVEPPKLTPAKKVRSGCERRARLWTRSAMAFTVLIVGATGFTLSTAPTRYEPPQSPGEQIEGVPVASGPQRLSKQDLKLREKLRKEPMNGPYRLVPQVR